MPLPGRQRRPIDGCVPAIARFYDCKVGLARNKERPRSVFFGFEPDTSTAVYLLAVIDRGIQQEVLGFRAQHRPCVASPCRSGVPAHQRQGAWQCTQPS